jgi:ketosteroid isomerase-like protein
VTTPEEKYYDGMNTLLAPVRWAKSLMQTVLIILLLIGAGLLYPLIQLVKDGHATFGGFVVSFLTVLLIFTFFYAPWYTVVGGIICSVVFYACCFSDSFVNSLTGTGFYLFVFAFLAFGILQKYIRRRLSAADEEPKPRQLSFVEQLNQDIRERNEQARVQAAFESEHRDTIETMRYFVSSCRQPLEDVLRGTSVLSGDTLVNANEAILMDIWQIWRRLELADGDFCLDAPQHLLKALCCVVEPKLITALDWELLMCELFPTLARQTTASPLWLPRVVSMLAKYDVHAGTQLASKAAATYRTVLLSLAALRNNSIAVKMAVDEYLKVLKPHITDGSDGSSRESTSTSTATDSSDGLSKDYATLGVRSDATPEEVKQAYRDLAKVWHPDRFAGGDMRLKQKAEEQIKAINDAYARIQEAQSRNQPFASLDMDTAPRNESVESTRARIDGVAGFTVPASSVPSFGNYTNAKASRYGYFWITGILCIAVMICVGVVIARRTPAYVQPASSVAPSSTPVSQAAEQSVSEAPAPSRLSQSPSPNDLPQTMTSATSRSDDEASVQDAVEGWANAFRGRDADRFAAYYAPEVEQFFRKKNVSQSQILDTYQASFGKMDSLYTYEISDLRVEFPDGTESPSRATATYNKKWDTSQTDGKRFSGEEVERLTFEKTEEGWKIVREDELRVLRTSRQ